MKYYALSRWQTPRYNVFDGSVRLKNSACDQTSWKKRGIMKVNFYSRRYADSPLAGVSALDRDDVKKYFEKYFFSCSEL